MSNSQRDFIADVMSGDEAHNSNPSSQRNYDLSDEETVVAGDDAALLTLLSETENVMRSFSNLSTYRTSSVDDKTFERKPWQSLYSLRPHQITYSQHGIRSVGTSDYVSDDLLLPTSGRSRLKDSMSHLYSNQNQIQTFSDTTSLLQTLKDELVTRTSELHKTENEYFNLKASFENLNGRFENAHSELSNLRTLVYSKDKQIKQLTEKVASLTSDISASREGCEAARSDLEKIRTKLDHYDQNADIQNESLSKEIKRRDEVIEQLRSELAEITRNNKTSRISEHSENQLKDKLAQFEGAIKMKEQKIMAQQRQIVEYEQEIQGLKEANMQTFSSKSEIVHLEQEIDLLKEQLDNARIKNDSVHETLLNSKKFYDEFKDASDKSVQDYARITQKLKGDYRELEEKHRESLNTLKQRGDSNKRLNDDIKELNEKLKQMENELNDTAKSIQILNLEKVENQRKIESLKSQLVAASITETNINISRNQEVENKQAYIEQLSQETVQLNRTIDDFREKLRIRENTIEQLNNNLVELENIRSSNQRMIQTLEEKVYQSAHRERMLEDLNKEKDGKLELLELDLKNSKYQYESVREEVNKISGEKRELERCLQRKEERVLQEVNDRSYETEGLKLELKKINQMLAIEQESCQHLSGETDKLLKEHNKLNKSFEKLSEDLETKDALVNDLSENEKRLQTHNVYLEEELTKMKLALEDSSEELAKVRKSWDSREDALGACKEESSRQKANNLELISKIEQRDRLLQSLTTETGKLKHKYQDKSADVTKLTEQNARLKESLQETESSLSGLNQKFEDMKNKKEKELNTLKTELGETQSQYSNCYDELMTKQEHLNKSQNLEKESSLKLTKVQEEMSQQQMDYDEMEAELNVIRAKYRACQEELFRRDEELLLLRTEVQSYQRDLLSFQTERPSFQKEIDRWKLKFTDLQEQLKGQRQESETMEDKISEKEQRIDELLSEILIVKQENINHLRSLEQLKVDLSSSKSTNSDRYNHFQAIIETLKAENETKNQEARFLEENCSKYRNDINRLKSELESLNQNILLCNEEMEQYKEKLRQKEDECHHWIQQTQNAQYLNEEAKISLDSMEKEITQFKLQFEAKDTKLRTQADALTKLKNEKNQSYKNMMDCQRQLDVASRDREDIEKRFEENIIKVKKYEQCIRDLNEELAATQVDMSNSCNKITRLESELNQMSMVTSHKHSTIDTLECKIAKMKSNINSFKNTHKTEDSEVESLNTLLLQHSKKFSELEDLLVCRNRERETIIGDMERKEKEIFDLKETFCGMKNEIDNLRREREEKSFHLDDIQKKYQYEIKKLKTYSKEVEEDMASLHNTIDDMQRQLDSKDVQLDKVDQRSQILDEELEKKKKEIVHLEQNLREIEIERRHNETVTNSEACKQSMLQKEIEQLQIEVKESRSLIFELTNQKTKFETKCASLEIMLEKADKKVSQSDAELKKMQATFFLYSKELDELRQEHQHQTMILEKTKDQYGKFSVEYNSLKGEKLNEKKKSTVLVNEVDHLKGQISNQLENVNMLQTQVEQQEAVIVELQNELLHERKKFIDLQNNDYQKRKTMNELENETDILSRTRQDLKSKLKEKERLANLRQNDNDKLNFKLRQATEAMIDKENKVKLLERKMQFIEEENIQLKQNLSQVDVVDTPRQIATDRSDYVNQLESTMTTHQAQLEHLRSELRQSNNKNYELSLDNQMREDEIQRIKQEKVSLQSKIASLPSNTDDIYCANNRKSQCLEEENESLQRMIRKLRYELEEKDQLLLKNHDESIRNLTSKLSHAQDQDSDNANRLKQLRSDVEARNKEIIELTETIERMRKENILLRSELNRAEDITGTLQGQNTTIMDNFNVWVQEQKVANERLGEKIRDQNRTIHDLRREKEVIQRDNRNRPAVDRIDKDISSSSSSYDEEKIILRNQLQITEENYEKIIQGKNKIIDELQTKVNDQIIEMTKLKQQILISQNDQQNTKIDLERAMISADSYKARSGGQHERLANIRSQLGSSSNKSVSRERQGPYDYDSHDKQYWIQRVGELSDELEQCQEYWSKKVRELSNNMDSSSASVDTLTPITS